MFCARKVCEKRNQKTSSPKTYQIDELGELESHLHGQIVTIIILLVVRFSVHAPTYVLLITGRTNRL